MESSTELEQEAETLSHAEDIKAGLYRAGMLIDNTDSYSILSQTKECIQTLQGISSVYPSASEWSERLQSCYIELKDIAHDLSSAEEDVEFNPERLDYVNQRLNLIYNLQQKHRADSIEELIDLAKNYQKQLNDIASFDDRISGLRAEKRHLVQ